MSTVSLSRVSGACPTFFRALILKSSASSYDSAGYALAMHARGLVEGEVSDDVLRELDQLVRAQDAEGLVAWMSRVLPKCVRLVPSPRRRGTFLAGVRAALNDERV